MAVLQLNGGLEVAKHLGAKAAGVLARFMGGRGSGAPSSGAWLVGDFVVDARGFMYVCTSAGTPGSWATVGRNGFHYIREYGGVTDGSTNSTDAFTAAMAAIQATQTPGLKFQNSSGGFQDGAQANGAGMILLDPGVIRANAITGAHRAVIFGHGEGSTIMRTDTQSGVFIKNRRDSEVHAAYFRILNLTIHMNKANQSTGGQTAVLFQGDESFTYNDTKDEDWDIHCRLGDCKIIEVKGTAVKTVGSSENKIWGNDIRDVDDVGIDLGYDTWCGFNSVAHTGKQGIIVQGDSCEVWSNKTWYTGRTDAANGQGIKWTADSGIGAGNNAQDNAAQSFLFDGAHKVHFHGTSENASTSSAGAYAAFDVYDSDFNVITGTAGNRFNGPDTTLATLAINSGSTGNDIVLIGAKSPWGITSDLKAGSSIDSSNYVRLNGVEQ